MSFSAHDHALMARALRLAARGAFTARPNPVVGCVLADAAGRVLGEGFHARAGEPHAEVHALRAAGDRARGATAYVTLEPCAHHGRTPPCADALVAAGVARVVVACGDPFEHVDGAGVARLREAGIAVETGLLEADALALNRGFFSRIRRARPWLRLKLAMSLDGRTALADGHSQWISSEAARRDVARARAAAGALLTGIGTVLADDPRLTVRLGDDTAFLPPLRVVLDGRARLPASARLLREPDAPLLWLTGAADGTPPAAEVATQAPVGADLVREGGPTGSSATQGQALPPHVRRRHLPMQDGRLDLHAVLRTLAEEAINEVQVEAGPTLSGALLREGLVDELLLYMAPVLLGARARPLIDGLHIDTMADRFGMHLVETRQVGPDLRLRLEPRPLPTSPS